MRWLTTMALRVAAILGEYIRICCLPSCLTAIFPQVPMHGNRRYCQCRWFVCILAGIAALSDCAGMISVDGGGTVCGSGGNVRVATEGSRPR